MSKTDRHEVNNSNCNCAQCEYRNSGQLEMDDMEMWRDARHLKRKCPDLTYVKVEKGKVFNMKTMSDEIVVQIVERLKSLSTLLMTMRSDQDANYAEEIISMARSIR